MKKSIFSILPEEYKNLINESNKKYSEETHYVEYRNYYLYFNKKLSSKYEFKENQSLLLILNARYLLRLTKRYNFNIMVFKKILLDRYNVSFDPIFPIIRSYLIPSFEDLFSIKNVKFI